MAYSLSQCAAAFDVTSISSSGQNVIQISSAYRRRGCCRDAGAGVAGVSAQSDDADPELRIQQLENQLRQLTGQNEELQYRNRQLEDRLRQLQGGAQAGPRRAARPVSAQPGMAQPNVAAATASAAQSGLSGSQPGYDQQQIAAPAPIVQESAPVPQPAGAVAMPSIPARIRMRPGAPHALGGGQLADAGRSAGRRCRAGAAPGEPLDLANTGAAAIAVPAATAAAQPGGGAALATLPPSATPKDEFDLGIGYMQRKDYALAEETMRNFAQKYPSDPLIADSQYWLGESFFQRQQYRDAAEAFLGGDHQIRQIGEGAGCPAAARAIAGGAEGKGSRLRRLRRGDAEISARLQPASRRPSTASRSG